jgi:TonB-linked SusC/RagA family outer membrane protein
MRKFLSLLAVLVLLGSLAFSQTKTVTGRVVDKTGQPVPFATVRVKGTKVAVSADANGYFSIKANSTETLEVTATGIAPTSVPVGDGTEITVTATRSSNLDEVVVTAMGTKRSKNSTPYSTQQISGNDLTKTVTTNLVNNLSGKIAGLQITASNAMGGSTNTILRGFRSLTQSNQALYVVDGVPYDNTIITGGGYDFGTVTQDLNPDDIASINVLKGAAASALYGSRGANGVILITTKRGVSRKGVGVTASFGISAGSPDKSTLPTYQTVYGQGYEKDIAAGAFYNEEVPWLPTPNSITIPQTNNDAATGPAYDPSLQVYNWDAFTPGDPNFHKTTAWAPAANHNPTDYFVTPYTTTENVMIQGGSEKGNYKLGYTRTDNIGYIPNSNIRKNAFDFSAGYNLTKDISIEAGLLYVGDNATNRYLYQYTGGTNPMTDFRQWWPTNIDIKQQKADYFNTLTNATWNWQNDGSYQSNSAGNIGLPAYHDNLYWFAYQNYEQDQRNRFTSHVKADWKFTDYLSFTGSVSNDYYSQGIQQRNNIGSQNLSFYSSQVSSFSETNYNGILNFNKNFGEDFNVKVLFGGNIQRDEIPSTFSSTNGGLVIPSFWSISNSVKTPSAPTETFYRKEINSLFGGLTLSWRDMITLDGTIRRDQSSTLPSANNTYYYPSISGNFIFSKLLPNVDWLSYGKFFANYAQVGNDAPYYATQNTYQINTPILGNPLMSNLAYTTAGAIANNNANLVPEQNKAYEFGLDMDFFERRVGLNVVYYHSVQSNEILPISVSTATGYNRFYVNGGSVQNQGVEVTLNLVPIKTHDFIWDINVNWSKNSNKVLSLFGGQSSYAVGSYQNSIQLVAEVGKPYGIIRGTDYVYVNGQPEVDAQGYYLRSSNRLSDIGSIQPDWIAGMTNSFSYKNWTLSFLIDVHQGGQLYSLDMDYGSLSGLYPNSAAINANGKNVRDDLANGGGALLDGVTADGKKNAVYVDENASNFWTFGSAYGTGAQTQKSFIYSASYVKLREAAIAYSFPAKTIKGLKYIQGINLSLSGRNLWIIHKDVPYADPEQGQAAGNASIGFQNGAYPTMREMSFIVKLTF